jgi:hypothetical protein
MGRQIARTRLYNWRKFRDSDQKFFGSFFQKRTILPSGHGQPLSTASR